jgi:IS6 family transposase
MQGKIRLSQTAKEFKYTQFEGEVILWAMRWYCQSAIRYRDLVLMA